MPLLQTADCTSLGNLGKEQRKQRVSGNFNTILTIELLKGNTVRFEM